jgi:hypothetical protein
MNAPPLVEFVSNNDRYILVRQGCLWSWFGRNTAYAD